jgi:hypothetical protein
MAMRLHPTCALLRQTVFVLSITLSTCRVVGDTGTSSTIVFFRGGDSLSSTDEQMATIAERNVISPGKVATTGVDVVFSDLDGTLIHYPERPDDLVKKEAARGILQLPPSSTGMVGVISSETLRLCQEVRRNGVKFVLVSGMRASTLLKRLPYLPKSDAYCCEAGGRIFYPATNETEGSFRVEPQPYDGAQPADLAPFYLSEDMKWRKEIERLDAAGKDGFVGHELEGDDEESQNSIPLCDREGVLWSHARTLEANGFVVDTKGYSTCFRINRKHQGTGVNFDSLADGNKICPTELSTSTNLGCIDFYPASSGKKNWYVCPNSLFKQFRN